MISRKTKTIDKLRAKISSFDRGAILIALRKTLFGKNDEEKGIIYKISIYFVLISVAILYLMPAFYIVSTMFKSFSDLIDPGVKWIPTTLRWDNLKHAFDLMNINFNFVDGRALWDNLRSSALFNTVSITLPSALIQVIACAVAGYAFGRLKFPGKSILFVILLLTFIIPPQTIILPLHLVYRDLGLRNTPFVYILPSVFGHGLRGSLFVFIYAQFFKKLPKELEEAAIMDGAGILRLFVKVMFPLAKPVIIVVFLFSLVWHWNETYLASNFYNTFHTLSIRISEVVMPETVGEESVGLALQPLRMASAFLLVSPLIAVYMVAQRWFVESVERTGLVE